MAALHMQVVSALAVLLFALESCNARATFYSGLGNTQYSSSLSHSHFSTRSQKLQLLRQQIITGAPAPAAAGSSAPLTSLTICPTDPLQFCDFYFEGHRSSLPLLLVPTNSTGDAAISPPIRDSKRGYTDPLGYLEVDSTNPALFLCPAPNGTNPDGTNSDLGNDFYITTSGSNSVVQVRNIQNLQNSTILDSRCVVIPITSAQIYPPGSSTILNLNKGDGNALFPESRRCVVFETGPTPPSCGPAPPPAPPPAPSACNLTCPATPLAQCDFFFDGFETTLPSFSIASMQPDKAFTPSILFSLSGLSSNSTSGTSTGNNTTGSIPVEIDSTGTGQLLNCSVAGNSTDSYFYGNSNQLFSRNINNGGYAVVVGQCVKLPLTSTAITLPGASSPTNFNVGDGNPAIPEDRRCVVFTVTP